MADNVACTVSSLSRKYMKAVMLKDESEAAFLSIDASITPEQRKAWSKDARRAAKERVHDATVMDIYDVRQEEGNQIPLLLTCNMIYAE